MVNLLTPRNAIIGLVAAGAGVVLLKWIAGIVAVPPAPSTRAVNKAAATVDNMGLGPVVSNDDFYPGFNTSIFGYEFDYGDAAPGKGMMPTIQNIDGNILAPKVMNAYYSKMQRLSI